MNQRLPFFLLLLFITGGAGAQNSPTSADMYLALRKLNTLGSILYVAAHPDDENTRLLTYFSKDKLYRTAYLSLTRGDGGQNLIGTEQGIELGLIRTQELLSARRIDGAEQFFTRAYDFGFSKNPQETFTKWDKEKVLSDVVWVIRKFQPDVIITRFPTTGEGGHGHHTASAILANEAFTAAADPKRFPEQLQWVKPWQAKRILWNTFNFGGNNTQRPGQFTFDVGGYNPVLGKSYGEIAAESRSQHKSQGFGVARSRGEALEFFVTTGGTPPAQDLFENVDAGWSRVKGGAAVAALLQQVTASFNFLKPQASVPALVNVHKAIAALEPGVWRDQKLAETEALIAQCSGIFLEAATGIQDVVQGDSVRVNLTLNNRGGADIRLQRIQLEAFDTTIGTVLEANRNWVLGKTLAVPADKPLSQPYWLREKMDKGMFVVGSQHQIGQPDVTPSFTVRFDLLVQGVPFSLTRPVQYKYTDPVKGEVLQPVFVVAPVSIYTGPDVLLFARDKKTTKEVELRMTAQKKLAAQDLLAELRSAGYYLSKKEATFSLDKGGERGYVFPVGNENMGGRETDLLQGVAHFNLGGAMKNAYLASTSIRYDHIPTIRYYYADNIR
ncbi:MAG TPA: PIG-L family deacetylase, partial [Chitinophagaceae bacterium]|nr:PIG-L family deacetylase [Chitinophagaceae bacterium]